MIFWIPLGRKLAERDPRMVKGADFQIATEEKLGDGS
jgi:hypothetical protein